MHPAFWSSDLIWLFFYWIETYAPNGCHITTIVCILLCNEKCRNHWWRHFNPEFCCLFTDERNCGWTSSKGKVVLVAKGLWRSNTTLCWKHLATAAGVTDQSEIWDWVCWNYWWHTDEDVERTVAELAGTYYETRITDPPTSEWQKC